MKIFKLCIIILLCISCSSDDDAPSSPDENVEFTVIADAILNGIVDVPQQNIVIGNEADWQNLIDLVDETGNISSINETDIDFSQYMILGVIDEIRPSGGYDKFISSITKNNFAVTVIVSSSVPESNTTTVITQPYHLVKIEKEDLPFNFQ